MCSLVETAGGAVSESVSKIPSMSIGDTEPDDEFSAEGEPDPEQVARHFHEERRWIGSGEPEWDHLPADVRAVAVALIHELIEWLRREGQLRE